MPSTKQSVVSQEKAKETLSNLLAAFEYLESAEPKLTFDGFKTLIVVALTSWDDGRPRLPDVTNVATVLEKSPSSGSRLVGNLSDPDGLALVESRPGLSGSRSEALALTTRGSELLSAFLGTLTGGSIEEIAVQNFGDFIAWKGGSKGDGNQSEIFLKLLGYDKSSLTMIVGPESDAMSNEIREWCSEYLSNNPEITAHDGSAAIKFAKISDAVYFKLRWCRR